MDPYSDDTAPAEAQAQPSEHSTTSHEAPGASLPGQGSKLESTAGQLDPTAHEAIASTAPVQALCQTCPPPHENITTPQKDCPQCGTPFAEMHLPPTFFRRKSSTFEDPRLPRWARDPGAGHDADTAQVGSTHDSTAVEKDPEEAGAVAEHHRSLSLRRLLHFNQGTSDEDVVAEGEAPHHGHSASDATHWGLDQLKRRLSVKDMQMPHMHH
ncbi:hypothetical protein LTR36_005760 [Oleoguttula mirabilis]|uniref:Uncharacterized protein n=1 Tax=Oleoguttula mirabilis TaxID=1507867 RepID=A0AAV9JDH5_9PEZI|nr:hypothetical protein LTR36_005760 [Oleoguttula mirabilis]